MNNFVQCLLQAIGTSNINSVSHNFTYYRIDGYITSLNKHIINDLYDIIFSIHEKDIILEIELGGVEKKRLSNKLYEGVKEEIRELLELEGIDLEEPLTSSFSFKVTIKWEESELNIFSWKEFNKNLNEISFEEAFKNWSKLIVNNFSATIKTWEDDYHIENDFFSFIPYKEIDQVEKKSIDQIKTENRDKVSHFVNAFDIIVNPDAFNFSDHNWPLATSFNNLRNILSLIFLSDYSRIKKNEIDYCIKGYKTINGKLVEKLDNKVGNELWYMYKWAYERGSFIDKIGILRNVIPIHITQENINTLEPGALLSAQSGYDLYLKDNVKQYIEIKNKISDMLLSQSEKAGQITKDMFSTFKTNLWTFVTFFVTTILAKVIDKTNNSYDKTVILAGIVLITLSVIFLSFALSEVKDEKERLKNKYLEIEYRYKDLLNSDDIEKIINFSSPEDLTPEERELNYINKKVNKYKLLWILCLVFLGLILISVWIGIL